MRLRVTLVMLALLAGSAHAQTQYPSRPIRLIAAQSAGSSIDAILRIVIPKSADVSSQASSRSN